MFIDFSKRNRKAQANTFPLRHFRRKYIDTQVKTPMYTHYYWDQVRMVLNKAIFVYSPRI